MRVSVLVSLALVLLMSTGLLAQDVSRSQATAKPYAQKWTRWGADGRSKAAFVRNVAEDFKVLAARDFVAACEALLKSKLGKASAVDVYYALEKPMAAGVRSYSRYVIAQYRFKRGEVGRPNYPKIPLPGKPWPGLVAQKSPDSAARVKARKLIEKTKASRIRLDASKAAMRGDYKTAYRFYKPLADNGDKSAQHSLATFYFYGNGVQRSNKKAFYWSQKSAEQGYTSAQYLLGRLYKIGLGTQKSEPLAARWFRAAAEKGHARAQNRLGEQYSKGLGVPQSDEQAVVWIRKAANQGLAKAQHNLAIHYQKGKGVERSLDQALEWLGKATAQNYPSAQHNMGILYELGMGVPKDRNKAIEWYRKSAKNGLSISKEALKRLGAPL